ncbi:MAG TPA: hypothetical protein PKM88_07280 [bacterium]|nr:hypothetical protein [bacterium]
MPDRHNPIISEYLAAFRAQLRGMSENEKSDLVLELEDHILTRLAEGMPADGALAASPVHRCLPRRLAPSRSTAQSRADGGIMTAADGGICA